MAEHEPVRIAGLILVAHQSEQTVIRHGQQAVHKVAINHIRSSTGNLILETEHIAAEIEDSPPRFADFCHRQSPVEPPYRICLTVAAVFIGYDQQPLLCPAVSCRIIGPPSSQYPIHTASVILRLKIGPHPRRIMRNFHGHNLSGRDTHRSQHSVHIPAEIADSTAVQSKHSSQLYRTCL